MPDNGSTTPLRALQGRSAAARRWKSADSDELARDYAAEKLADYIKRTVDAAPPLTPEQRLTIARMLIVSPTEAGGPDGAA